MVLEETSFFRGQVVPRILCANLALSTLLLTVTKAASSIIFSLGSALCLFCDDSLNHFAKVRWENTGDMFRSVCFFSSQVLSFKPEFYKVFENFKKSLGVWKERSYCPREGFSLGHQPIFVVVKVISVAESLIGILSPSPTFFISWLVGGGKSRQWEHANHIYTKSREDLEERTYGIKRTFASGLNMLASFLSIEERVGVCPDTRNFFVGRPVKNFSRL